MYAKYRPECYWYEAVMTTTKVLVVVPSVLISSAKWALTLGIVTTLILIVALGLQLHFKPFAAEPQEHVAKEYAATNAGAGADASDAQEEETDGAAAADGPRPSVSTSNKVAAATLKGQVTVGVTGVVSKLGWIPTTAEWVLGLVIMTAALAPIVYTLVAFRRRRKRVTVHPGRDDMAPTAPAAAPEPRSPAGGGTGWLQDAPPVPGAVPAPRGEPK